MEIYKGREKRTQKAERKVSKKSRKKLKEELKEISKQKVMDIQQNKALLDVALVHKQRQNEVNKRMKRNLQMNQCEMDKLFKELESNQNVYRSMLNDEDEYCLVVDDEDEKQKEKQVFYGKRRDP